MTITGALPFGLSETDRQFQMVDPVIVIVRVVVLVLVFCYVSMHTTLNGSHESFPAYQDP